MADYGLAATGGRGGGTLVGCDGTPLAFRSWTPPAHRAALMVVHGLGEHGGRYDEFARRMSGFDFMTFALDLRGHGRSGGPRGHVADFQLYLDDLDIFRREVEARSAGRPLFIIAQSMGGLIALRYIQDHEPPLRAAVICSPWLATAMPVPRLKAALAPLLARFLPALPLRTGLRAVDLSRDPHIVAAYRDDPLVHGRITPATFAAVTSAMHTVQQRHDRVRLPLLLLLGGADRVVDTATSEAFGRTLPGPDVTIAVLPDHYHELLNETDRALTYDTVGGWLRDRI